MARLLIRSPGCCVAVSFAGVPDCFTKAGNYLQIFIHIFFWGGGYLSVLLQDLPAPGKNWAREPLSSGTLAQSLLRRHLPGSGSIFMLHHSWLINCKWRRDFFTSRFATRASCSRDALFGIRWRRIIVADGGKSHDSSATYPGDAKQLGRPARGGAKCALHEWLRA